ncbi:hypothetical protein EBZ80_11495 [bacterium]|nr:hypothetical protein [bacterium]
MAAPSPELDERERLFQYIFIKFDSLIPELADHIAYPRYGMLYGKVADDAALKECISGFGGKLLALLNKRKEIAANPATAAGADALIAKLEGLEIPPIGYIRTKSDYVSAIRETLTGVFKSGMLSTLSSKAAGKSPYDTEDDCKTLSRLIAFSSNTTKTAPGTYGINALVLACYNYEYNKPVSDASLKATIDEITGTDTLGMKYAKELETRLAALQGAPSSGMKTGGRRRHRHRRATHKRHSRSNRRSNRQTKLRRRK